MSPKTLPSQVVDIVIFGSLTVGRLTVGKDRTLRFLLVDWTPLVAELVAAAAVRLLVSSLRPAVSSFLVIMHVTDNTLLFQ